MHQQRYTSLARLAAAIGLAMFLLSGCNEEPPERIDAANFDQSCQTALDCRRVDETTCQECNGVGTAAINKDALDEFQQEKDAIVCHERSSRNCNNASAVVPFVTCQDNTCGIWDRGDPEGLIDQVSRSCTQDSDCVPLRSSEPVVCTYDTCECPDRAVNRQAWEKTLVASCDAQSPYPDCNMATACSDRRNAVCEQGECVLAP